MSYTQKTPNEESTLVTGHEYDGIQELDNPVPGWWHLLWLLSFIFLFTYFPFSLISPMYPSPVRRLEAAQVAEYERLFSEIGELSNDETTLVSLMGDADWMLFAASAFQTNCASCHSSDGGGLIGPNLTDDSYKNVSTLTDIHPVLANGAAGGAMPAWSTRLSNNELVLLSAYVATLRGTTPGSARAPEGEPIPAWPAPDTAGEDAS